MKIGESMIYRGHTITREPYLTSRSIYVSRCPCGGFGPGIETSLKRMKEKVDYHVTGRYSNTRGPLCPEGIAAAVDAYEKDLLSTDQALRQVSA